jgi:hypothetical protein
MSLGRSTTKLLIEHLKREGIDLSSEQESYSLHEIRDSLARLVGIETADLLVERLRKDLNVNKPTLIP